jgi:hypothetical protein
MKNFRQIRRHFHAIIQEEILKDSVGFRKRGVGCYIRQSYRDTAVPDVVSGITFPGILPDLIGNRLSANS